MQTRVKTAAEISAMRISGQMLATVLEDLRHSIKPGMTTQAVADRAAEKLDDLGGKPAFLGYQGFPDVICISVNNQVVHGIPGDLVLKSGDIVGLDFGVVYKGMITDGAISVIVGSSGDQESKQLIRDTEAAMYAGIECLHDGVRVGDIGAAVGKVLNKGKYGIVRDLVGHGVGHELHEDPNIPNYGRTGTGPVLKAGMTIAIEPMATLGSEEVVVADDQWTVQTLDDSLSAHFEHTVLITQDGYEVLTKL
ncbi:MAG: type I methionyl aminopeptidase [Candidatus Saccharibacteria bacterium]